MRERLLALALGLAALALFWALFFPKPQPPNPALSRPHSADRGPDGYAALARWLTAEGRTPLYTRRRFDEPGALPAGAGHLLVTTLPYDTRISTPELRAIDRWLGLGNSALVVAALDDTPAWSEQVPGRLDAELVQLAHLHVHVIPQPRDEAGAAQPAPDPDEAFSHAFEPRKVDVVALAPHPLLEGVGRLATLSALPASRWQAAATDRAPLLALAKRADTDDPALWIKSQSGGRLLILAYASVLGNGLIGEADNARFVSNAVAQLVGPAGRVVFDEFHAGRREDYDPQAFYGDPRLHRSLACLVGLWLLFVVGALPFRPAPGGRPALDDAAFLRTSAGFLANAVTPATAASALLAHFYNSVRTRIGLRADGQPVFDWLARHAAVAPVDLVALRDFHARAAEGRRVNLPSLYRLLRRLTGNIA
jgi:hypothetical protein